MGKSKLAGSKKPKKPFGFFKTTAVGALLIVVPIGIIGFALWQVTGLLKGMLSGMLTPLFEKLNLQGATIQVLVVVWALLLVVLICFLTGVLVRTRWGKRLRAWVERLLLEKIPGYKMVRSLAHQYLGEEDERRFRPVMVDVHNTGAKMVGLEIEELGDGTVAVFFPSVPAVTLGQVQIVPEERVEAVSASLHATLETLTMFGEGASKLIDAEPTP